MRILIVVFLKYVTKLLIEWTVDCFEAKGSDQFVIVNQSDDCEARFFPLGLRLAFSHRCLFSVRYHLVYVANCYWRYSSLQL